MTQRGLKLSHILSLAFVGLIFAFTVVSFLPSDDGLLTDTLSPPLATLQADS